MELATEDKQRIEQEAKDRLDEYENRKRFIQGAEYATRYEREQQLPYEKIHYDQAETIVFLDQKVKQLEAERAYLHKLLNSLKK